MILYGSSLSPFVRKVMVFAAEKAMPLTFAPGGMGRGGPDFAEASPFAKMPALRDPGVDDGRDFTISDSSAIVQYLEARQPAPALIPTDAIARARVIWFEEFGDTMLAKLVGACFFNRIVAPRFLKQPGNLAAADAAERDELPPLMDYLEQAAAGRSFLVGDAITLADIVVASPLVSLAHASVNIDPDRWPEATRYLAGIVARPSFAPVVAAERQLLARTA